MVEREASMPCAQREASRCASLCVGWHCFAALVVPARGSSPRNSIPEIRSLANLGIRIFAAFGGRASPALLSSISIGLGACVASSVSLCVSRARLTHSSPWRRARHPWDPCRSRSRSRAACRAPCHGAGTRPQSHRTYQSPHGWSAHRRRREAAHKDLAAVAVVATRARHRSSPAAARPPPQEEAVAADDFLDIRRPTTGITS